MTGERFPRASWPWADPFWWAERQFEAAALMLRLTEAMVSASVAPALGQAGRAIEHPPGRVPAPAGPAATATVTVPPPAPAPAPVADDAATRTWAGEPQAPGEAAEGAKPAPAGEPPVPGWAELTLGSIRARLRRLSEEDLVALQGYEESHSARPEVLSMLQNRLTKVRSEN